MSLENFKTASEKIRYLTSTEEGKKELGEIQEEVTKISLAAIDSSNSMKRLIERLKARGIVINVGISVAVGLVDKGEETEDCPNDSEFLNSLGLSWSEDEQEN